MSVRAAEDLKFALIKTFTVAAASTSTPGLPQTLTAENTCRDSTSGEAAIGVAYVSMANGSPAGAAAAAGNQVQVTLVSNIIARMLVGSAGATAGLYQVMGTGGVTDAVTPGGGSVAQNIVGIALQTGVSGDYISVLITRHTGVHA